MSRRLWWCVVVGVGCAGGKGSDGVSEEGTLGGSYVVTGGDDAQGSLGETGDGGSGDSSSGDGGSGDGGSGDGSSGDGGSGDGGSGDGSSGGGGSGGESGTDRDGDGYDSSVDCDDADADTYPGATEYCDGIDTDCDGSLDRNAVDKVTSYEDSDGDGFGNPDVYLWACNVPSDYVLNDDDCDDTDASRNPDLGCDWNGSYVGTLTLTAVVSGLADTCTARLTMDVDESARPAATGDSTCVWAGLGASLIGDVDFEIDGSFSATDTIEGDVTIDGFGSEAWSGTFTSPGNLYGTASGSGTYSGLAYTYTAELDLNR